MGPMTPDEWWPHVQVAMANGDMQALLALYEPGVAFANRSGAVRHGHAEFREEVAPLVAARADFQVNVTKIIESGDLALLHSEFTTTWPHATSGHALEVLRRQPDGRWLLAIGDPFTVGQRPDH